jgi:quercetin dioxygenase-like cupin family protein
MNKLIILAACAASMTAAAGNKLDIKQSEISWVQPFGAKGPSLGFVEGKYGDKEPASFFVKFSAGGDSGWHFHNEDYQGVVLSGTFTEQQQGERAETKLPAGTYFTQPAKIVHRNGCLKGADCLVYVHFAKGADSIITTADGKPVKK